MESCCDPTDVRGKAGIGSVTSLDAIGRQEDFLLGNASFFEYAQKRHTNFSSYQTSVLVQKPPGVKNWPFGRTIVIDDQIKPQQMGDLLRNIYFKCTMPLLQDVAEYDTAYCDQIGRSIIKTVSFTVDGIEIEKIYDDWSVIRDQLYLSADQKLSMQSLVNGGQPEGTLPTSNIRAGPIDLYIPLNFFFANNSCSYFPICAILNQKIKLEFVFHSVPFFSDTRTSDSYPGSPYECSLANFEIVFEQIAVSDSERYYLQNTPQKLLIETVKRQPVLNIPRSTLRIKNFLVPSIPVETFHWVFRNSALENEITTNKTVIFNRFNYSSNIYDTSITDQAKNPVMSDASFFVNGQSELGFFETPSQNNIQTSNYYKYIQPLAANFSSPDRNVYTYAYALNQPSQPLTGAIDFKKLIGDKTFINVSLLKQASNVSDYNMHMFYMGLVTLTFENGFMNPY
jgi:hypothetical protein